VADGDVKWLIFKCSQFPFNNSYLVFFYVNEYGRKCCQNIFKKKKGNEDNQRKGQGLICLQLQHIGNKKEK